jgi:hypothetical protein
VTLTGELCSYHLHACSAGDVFLYVMVEEPSEGTQCTCMTVVEHKCVSLEVSLVCAMPLQQLLNCCRCMQHDY